MLASPESPIWPSALFSFAASSEAELKARRRPVETQFDRVVDRVGDHDEHRDQRGHHVEVIGPVVPDPVGEPRRPVGLVHVHTQYLRCGAYPPHLSFIQPNHSLT